MSKVNPNSEFIKAIEQELKKLSPTLSLSLSIRSDPLSQILEIVRIAINTLSQEKQNLECEYMKLSKISASKPNEDSNELIQARNKLVNAQKELEKYQLLLADKEKQLEIQVSELANEYQALSQEKRNAEIERSIYEGRSHETEIRIKALLDKENQLKSASEVLLRDRQQIERDKKEIDILKEKIEKNYNESEKIREVNLIAQENLQRDIEKYETECRILEDKNQAISLKQNYLEKIQEDIERKKKVLEEEKYKIHKEREYLQNYKQQISDERLNLREEIQEFEKTRRFVDTKLIEYKTVAQNPEITGSKELGSLFEKLASQIEIFNQEISEKENKIAEERRKNQLDKEKISTS